MVLFSNHVGKGATAVKKPLCQVSSRPAADKSNSYSMSPTERSPAAETQLLTKTAVL